MGRDAVRLVVVASMLVAIVASGVLWARAGWVVGVTVTAMVAAAVVLAVTLPWVDWPARGKTD